VQYRRGRDARRVHDLLELRVFEMRLMVPADASRPRTGLRF
jgi:hypothetical protein